MKAYNFQTQKAWYAFIVFARESMRRYLLKLQVGTLSISKLNTHYMSAKERLNGKRALQNLHTRYELIAAFWQMFELNEHKTRTPKKKNKEISKSLTYMKSPINHRSPVLFKGTTKFLAAINCIEPNAEDRQCPFSALPAWKEVPIVSQTFLPGVWRLRYLVYLRSIRLCEFCASLRRKKAP